MNPDILIEKINSVYNRLHCEPSIQQELYDYFTFKVPNFHFGKAGAPAWLRKWNGDIHLFNRKYHNLYRGLYQRVEAFAFERDYSVEYAYDVSEKEFSEYEAREFIKTVGIPSTINGEKFEVTDYQVKSFAKMVRKGRGLVLSPTGSGKSLMIYLLVRYHAEKSLIIVPNVNLVEQLMSHFQVYGFDTSKIHPIFAGQEISSNKRIYVSTWQSIYQLDKDYFRPFGFVVCDEVHLAQAKSIKGLMEKLEECDYRFGFTGTLDDLPTHRLVLEGLFGPVDRVASTFELIEQGYLSPLRIKAIILKYPPEQAKIVRGFEYADEREYLSKNEARKRFINNLTLSLDGNTLVLFTLVNQGKIMLDEIKARTNRPVYLIYGDTPGDERERIRKILETESNAILLGSYGCVSTGLDAPSLRYLIFASPYKSRIKVLQSIGRGLRKYPGKDETVLYDIVDDLTHNKRQNFVLKHFIARIGIYIEEKFPYQIYKVQLNR